MSEMPKKRGRPAKEKVEFVMPSTEKEVLQIQNAIKEASNSKTRIEGENDNIKSIKEILKEELGMPPKLFNQMLKAYHKSAFDEQISEAEAFEETYRKVFKITD